VIALPRIHRSALALVRRTIRARETALIPLAVAVGLMAGLATVMLGTLAHGLQALLYGVGFNRLSALASIRHPLRLLALPLGGLVLVALNRAVARWPGRAAPVDVVEANALHGGRIPMRDTLVVSAQTIVSNGFGASVGLEAAYAQAGGGLASIFGQGLRLKRGDLRVLVGAGAGAAVGAAFGSALTGAFYAFEIVIGAYTPATLAPVAAAALAGAVAARALGAEPYLIVSQASSGLTSLDYLMYALLGLACAVVGIGVIRAQTLLETGVNRLRLPAWARPVIGGLLLMPIAWITPQALSSGHGALRLELALQPAVTFLALVFVLKALASIVSLSFGFRGGLFFASLFLGSLLGPIFADGVNAVAGVPLLSGVDAALVGMAALSVTIVGGPMTLSLLVLEATHNFSLTGAVLTASLCASAFTRAQFGYSFSTWRLHLRGSPIRSPRDIGWIDALTADRLMRASPVTVDAQASVGGFRQRVPLGSTSRVVLVDGGGRYCGIVETARAYAPDLDVAEPIQALARLVDAPVAPDTRIDAILDLFEAREADDLAVVDGEGRVIGILTEKYVNRRYIEESEKSQGQFFGE
jgi:CIC family chloride channel protein